MSAKNSSEEMRMISERVFDDKVPGHIVTCPVAKKVDSLSRRVWMVLGVLIFLGAVVPTVSGLLLWALDRASTRADQLQQAIQDVRVLVEHKHAEELPPTNLGTNTDEDKILLQMAATLP